jgi:hypothetical protein
MAKHIFLGYAGKTLEEFGQDASAYLEPRRWIERCAVHVRADIRDTDSIVAPSSDGPDVAIEIWTSEEPMDWEMEIAAAPLRRPSGYQVDEVVEKGDGVYPLGRMEGITVVAFIWPIGGLPICEVRARYARHAPLARRVHTGLDRYSRHWVDRISTPGATAWCGVSILRYPTDWAYAQGHYESSEGRAAISYDVSGFTDLSRTLAFHARTHVYR